MSNEFYHSAKGTHWTKKKHKYVSKIGGKYIYPTQHVNAQKVGYYNRKLSSLDKKYTSDPWAFWDEKNADEVNEYMKQSGRRNKAALQYELANQADARKKLENSKYVKKTLVTKNTKGEGEYGKTLENQRIYTNMINTRSKIDPYWTKDTVGRLMGRIEDKQQKYTKSLLYGTALGRHLLSKSIAKEFKKDNQEFASQPNSGFTKAQSRGKKFVTNLFRRFRK